MTLTIYSNDYDKKDGVSDGMSGRVFLDPGKDDSEIGTDFGKGAISDALMNIVNGKVKIDEIMFCYRDKRDGQMFRRFTVNN